jgi:outer membrane protein assembly factor BamB
MPMQRKQGNPNWPQFRGNGASGVADGWSLPKVWDVEKGDGVLWKSKVPGLGHSSPVIYGERVYVTTAVGAADASSLRIGLYGDIGPAADSGEQSWRLLCFDRKSGKELWSRELHRGVPRIQRHTKGTHANPTVATDGKTVVAFFGSEGLYATDTDGNLKWKRDLGVLDAGYFAVPSAQWGFASSPVIVGDKVLVQCDVQKGGFLAALDLRTGQDVWRTARQDVPTWGTPAVVGTGSSATVVVNGWKEIAGYALATGERRWWMRGGGDIPVPTPLVAGNLVVITNSHGNESPILAVRGDATGDLTRLAGKPLATGLAWERSRGGAYMQTPIAYRGLLYVCRDNGVLGCYVPETGKELYSARLGSGRSGFTASAVAGDGRIFFTSEEGDVLAIEAGRTFRMVGGGILGEPCLATPAIARGVLYFRTQRHVIAVGRPG